MNRENSPGAREHKLLFTPGPLTTSLSVKQAMLHDVGSWDREFNSLVAGIRERLLKLAGLSRADGWDVVPMQGSGSFGVEAVFQTCVPPRGKVAVLTNGAYGDRMVKMLEHAKIDHVVLRTAESVPCDPAALDECLATDSAITHVAVVHCETTTGILNPIKTIGCVVKDHGAVYVVDAISSFGGMPLDFEDSWIDFAISSSNKCIEGVPGFSFVFCRRAVLMACEGWARSLSLDLLAQLKNFDETGKFRYTPPTQVFLAFDQALKEMEAEGGVAARAARYGRNHETLQTGMRRLGFRPFLNPAVQSHIITAFLYPDHDAFNFASFYERLSERGFIIYPGKLTQADTFRVGNIGQISEADLLSLLEGMREVLLEMGVLPTELTTSTHA